VQIRYQITFDDYVDACGSHYSRLPKAQEAKAKHTRRVFRIVLLIEASLVVLLVAILLAAGWMIGGPQFIRMLSVRTMFTRLAMTTLTLIPVIALLVLFFVLAIAQKRPRSAVRMMFVAGFVSIVIGAIAIWLVETNRRDLVRRYGSAPFESPLHFASIVSWAVVLFLWIALMYLLAVNWKKNWQRLTNQHRPKTADISAAGICISDGASRLEYSWDAIAKVVDTPSLLMLYLDELIFHIVPKRSFGGDVELDEFWKCAGDKGESSRQGFVVVAPVASAPIYPREESRP
jgi:hypothetical protein